MANLKKLYGQQANCYRYRQRDFLSLIREFSGGKLKQKGFFHSVAGGSLYLIFIKSKANFGLLEYSLALRVQVSSVECDLAHRVQLSSKEYSEAQ
jgi:hypothetical protein